MFFNDRVSTIYAKKTIISKKTKYLPAFKQFIYQLINNILQKWDFKGLAG